MKLVRFGAPGRERPGLWLDNGCGAGQPGVLDVRAMAFDLEEYDAHFFAHGGLARLAPLLAERDPPIRDARDLRLGAPVARPSKMICMGKNYAAHAAEFGSDIPKTPVLFAKAVSAVNGPCDPIRMPACSRIVDGEAELAFVVGRRARCIREEDAFKLIAGYLVFNDVTDREAQRAGQQWFIGKGADSFAPLGPFLVTADEVPDPHGLRIFQRINGETLQDDSTASMLFRIPRILAYITARMTLEPGDIVATGTPSGIGSARTPPVLLKPGDIVETGVEQLGTQRAEVVKEGDAEQ